MLLFTAFCTVLPIDSSHNLADFCIVCRELEKYQERVQHKTVTIHLKKKKDIFCTPWFKMVSLLRSIRFMWKPFNCDDYNLHHPVIKHWGCSNPAPSNLWRHNKIGSTFTLLGFTFNPFSMIYSRVNAKCLQRLSESVYIRSFLI